MSTTFTLRPALGAPSMPAAAAVPDGVCIAVGLTFSYLDPASGSLAWARAVRVWADNAGGGRIVVEAEPGNGPPPPR